MNRTRPIRASLPALLGMAAALAALTPPAADADPNLPVSAQPLANIFHDMPGSDWHAVQAEAAAETATQPSYKSNAVENVAFAGYFRPADPTAKLAILCDDGADVYIDGQRVVQGYQNPQALPDLAHSLTPISQALDPGHIYFIKVVYSNVILTGPTDIDGATLFCYGGGGSLVTLSANVQVRRTGSGDPFAPAAAVAAGAGSSNQADAEVTMTQTNGTPAAGVYVPAPSLTNAAGANLNAVISPDGQIADGNGNAQFQYHGSDQVTTEYVANDPNSPPPSVTITEGNSSATISQHWNEIIDGSEWGGDDYFCAGSPAAITFAPQYLDGSSPVPITGHTIRFVATSVQVSQYNPSTDSYVSTIYSIDQPSDSNATPQIVNVASLDQYITISPTVTESNGVYTGQFTVTDDSVDYVEYEAEDDSALGE